MLSKACIDKILFEYEASMANQRSSDEDEPMYITQSSFSNRTQEDEYDLNARDSLML